MLKDSFPCPIPVEFRRQTIHRLASDGEHTRGDCSRNPDLLTDVFKAGASSVHVAQTPQKREAKPSIFKKLKECFWPQRLMNCSKANLYISFNRGHSFIFAGNSFTPRKWRRGRDSNPRYAFDVYSLSRGAPSTTRPPLRWHRDYVVTFRIARNFHAFLRISVRSAVYALENMHSSIIRLAAKPLDPPSDPPESCDLAAHSNPEAFYPSHRLLHH